MGKILIIILSLFISSCGQVVENGYYLNDNVFSIKEGLTHRSNAINIIGEPYVQFNDNIWLYYSYSVKKYGIKRSELVKEKILILKFDEDGILEKKFYKELEGNTINLKDIEHKTPEEQTNLFKDILENSVPTMLQ